MPRGRTRSSLNRSQRLEEAYKLFARGYTNADVARSLRISADTATAYRRKYEEGLAQQTASNPQIFTQVLHNTQRALVEIDEVRRDAWSQIQKGRQHTAQFECEECGHTQAVVLELPITDANRSKYHKTILTAQQMRAQLHQLLTNRTEVLIKHENTRIVQERILAWMQSHLNSDQREQLALFIENELAPLMGELPSGASSENTDELEILDAEVVEN